MNELIEKLKNNRVPLKWLTQEERDLLDSLSGNLVYMTTSGTWSFLHSDCMDDTTDDAIIRINKDYTPEQKMVEKLGFFPLEGKYSNDMLLHVINSGSSTIASKINNLIDARNTLVDEVNSLKEKLHG